MCGWVRWSEWALAVCGWVGLGRVRMGPLVGMGTGGVWMGGGARVVLALWPFAVLGK